MKTYAKVLVLGNEPEASELTEHLAPGVMVTKAHTLSETTELLDSGHHDLLFCQWECSGGTWRAALAEIQNRRIEVPVIVFCHCGGESDWVEVLNTGAFDLLVPPYSAQEVNAAVEHALASRNERDAYHRSEVTA
jgi:DNA-binding NtrC family response regulator